MCGGSPKTQTAPLPVMPAERSAMKMPDSGTILTDARRKVTGKGAIGASTILTNQLNFSNDTSTKKTLLGQ
jgi:hypothetical protein